MNQSRLGILDRLERGEIAVEDAARALAGEPEPEPQSPSVLTRRERMLALAERIRDWDPHHMVTLVPDRAPRPWPWPEQTWQWFWQDLDHPVHVDHTLDLADGCALLAVMYEGDLNLTGWEGTTLRIGAAAFDLRIGREERAVRTASSTGTLDLRIPTAVSHMDVKALPGDILVRDLHIQRLCLECESGDLRCERIRGDIEARLRGCDANLFGIEGEITLNATRGSIRVREVRSTRMHLTADGGISLFLDTVDGGNYRCETHDGDIELSLPRDSACDLSAEATDGGIICPVELPWTELSERSQQGVQGTLGGGGASIQLVTKDGRIYITAY